MPTLDTAQRSISRYKPLYFNYPGDHIMARSTLPIVAATLIIACSVLGGASKLHAQCPNDCTFLITANCAIPANCFPLTVTTEWTNGVTTAKQNNVVTNCGIHSRNQPAPCPPVPAPFWGIAWASLDGGTTRAYPNGPAVTYVLPNCGITVCLVIQFGPTGCVNANIYLC